MKNVYMVQASTTYGGNLFKAAYLPYAAGLLVANAWEDETIRSRYAFKRFVFTREATDEAVASFETPAVIGFSNYIWNTRYNLALARKTKERFPECVIIFGGHNVPPGDSFLRQYPFIDFLIHAEGEDAFRALLLELLNDRPDFNGIHNLSFRSGDGYVTTPEVVQTRTDYPSPYLTGVFDSIFEEHPDMQLDAILETSRGCPRHCAYCDWGCTASAVRLFPMERVLAEIDWFAAHKVAFLWGADANFGAYARDEEITRHLIEVREKYGYPERLRTNYAKNNRDRVFRINRMLERDGMTKEGATLSFQSLNPDTLKAIGRQNMSLAQFREQIAMYRADGVTTYSELILGLPLETYESFCRGIGLLLENGQHRKINVYNCELLPNSPMAQPAYREKYGIKRRMWSTWRPIPGWIRRSRNGPIMWSPPAPCRNSSGWTPTCSPASKSPCTTTAFCAASLSTRSMRRRSAMRISITPLLNIPGEATRMRSITPTRCCTGFMKLFCGKSRCGFIRMIFTERSPGRRILFRTWTRSTVLTIIMRQCGRCSFRWGLKTGSWTNCMPIKSAFSNGRSPIIFPIRLLMIGTGIATP